MSSLICMVNVASSSITWKSLWSCETVLIRLEIDLAKEIGHLCN